MNNLTEKKLAYVRKGFSFLIKIKGAKKGYDSQYIQYPSSHYDDNTMDGNYYFENIVPHEVIMINGVMMNCDEMYKAAIKGLEENIKDQYKRATTAPQEEAKP